MDKVFTPDLDRVKNNRLLAFRRANQVLAEMQDDAIPREPKFLEKDRRFGKFSMEKPKVEFDEVQKFITENINHFRDIDTPNEALEDLNMQASLRELSDILYLTLRTYKFPFIFEDLFGKPFAEWSKERIRDGGKNNLQQVLKLSLLIILLESYGRGEEDYQYTQLIKTRICKIVKNLTKDIKWFYDLLSHFDCRLSELFFNIKVLVEVFSSIRQINKRTSFEILDFRLAELIKANVLES
ncbi:MAG: hypothetical protein ACMG57_03120 [Candidatus Dojkabacteria bacterium]